MTVYDTEEARFTRAFYWVLHQNSGKAPSPTQINKALGKDTNPDYRSPMNVLNGRMSKLRRRLLEENGFHKGLYGKWVK